MAIEKTYIKGFCLALGMGCLVMGQAAASAGVKCFFDGSYAHTLDVSPEDAEAYCEAQRSNQSEDDLSAPINVPQSVPLDEGQTETNEGDGQGSREAQNLPGPAPIALMLAGLVGLARLRRR